MVFANLAYNSPAGMVQAKQQAARAMQQQQQQANNGSPMPKVCITHGEKERKKETLYAMGKVGGGDLDKIAGEKLWPRLVSLFLR